MALLCAALLSLCALTTNLYSAPPARKGVDMDYGPFLSYTVDCKTKRDKPGLNFALKGFTIRVGEKQNAAICFDSDLMRYAAGWTGGFLDLSLTHMTTSKGSEAAFPEGTLHFHTTVRPGWGAGEGLLDPRLGQQGPLPASAAKYKGLFRHGNQVVLHYTVLGTEVFELPGFEGTQESAAFSRTFYMDRSDRSLTLLICEVNPATSPAESLASSNMLQLSIPGERSTVISFLTSDQNRSLRQAAKLALVDKTRVQLTLPAISTGTTFKVVIRSSGLAASDSAPPDPTIADPRKLCHGGPSLWPQKIPTKGRRGFGKGSYVVDTLTLPENNPWKSWMRLVALDFFSDGRAAVSTWNGDVWIVSGIDDKLDSITWKRFAAGLFEPLGLKIVDDQIYVLGRDQITRLHDLNGDGEADFYENFNNDAGVGPSYHAFAFDLHTDSQGNFYYIRCGQRVDPALALSGGMVKVSRDGQRSERIATGLRAANGMAIGPNDEITCADNQGNWVPTSRINWVKPGGFYGYMPHAHREPAPTSPDPPLCWIPYQFDNSSGSQVWVTSQQWGPLAGQLLHTSYGRGSLFLVLHEEVDGLRQGGVLQLPLKFDSGIMRGRFHPLDGQLYLCGLKGWQTSGTKDGGLYRVRYTGAPVYLPTKIETRRDGLQISFSQPLNPTSATNVENYAVEQWNYRWTDKYGSDEYSVLDPNLKKHDPVTVESVSLGTAPNSVFLKIPELKPVMQMAIKCRLGAQSGEVGSFQIYYTINRVPRE